MQLCVRQTQTQVFDHGGRGHRLCSGEKDRDLLYATFNSLSPTRPTQTQAVGLLQYPHWITI